MEEMTVVSNYLAAKLDAWLGNDSSSGFVKSASIESAVLALVNSSISDVTAYKDLLRSINDMEPGEFISFEEWSQHFPFLTKETFVNKYSIILRCRGGTKFSLKLFSILC